MHFDFQDIVSLITFALIGIFLIKDRKKIERHGLLFIRRSNFAKKFIENYGRKHSSAINKIAILAVITSLILMGVGLYYLTSITIKNITKPPGYKATPSVGLVLPTLKPICKPPYVICVPPLYWLIVILVVIGFHEPMHGLIAAANKIRIKSVGYAFLTILPAAFVEPDEKQFKKTKETTKIKVYSGGSFGNIISAVLFFGLLLLINKIFYVFFTPIGIAYDVIKDTPAYYSNLTGYMISINNISVNTIDKFITFMNSTKPNQTIVVITSTGKFNITLAKHPDNPNKGFIGVTNFREVYKLKNEYSFLKPVESSLISLLYWLAGLFNWIFFISIAVAIFNMLPIKPLDGGLMTESILKILNVKNAEKISNAISYFVLLMLLASIIYPII